MENRMLGKVSLELHGTTSNPGMMDALKCAIARSQTLTGQLYTGWPIGAEATLVSGRGQVTAIDLSGNPQDNEYPERQDRAFVAVDRTLRLDPALMNRRDPKIQVKTLTICSGVRQTFPDHPEHPLVNIAQATQKLEEFQRHFAPKGIDPCRVVNALMFTSVPPERTEPSKRR